MTTEHYRNNIKQFRQQMSKHFSNEYNQSYHPHPRSNLSLDQLRDILNNHKSRDYLDIYNEVMVLPEHNGQLLERRVINHVIPQYYNYQEIVDWKLIP